jgi:branched-subunit amino acid aminotransferase/4-amino-4-deoxychorismate lyase
VTTAPLSVGLLSGITRRTVIELCASLGIRLREERFTPEELRAADEVFITSSLKQVMPIGQVDGSPVGEGRIGPVTERLLNAYREAVSSDTGVVPEVDP